MMESIRLRRASPLRVGSGVKAALVEGSPLGEGLVEAMSVGEQPLAQLLPGRAGRGAQAQAVRHAVRVEAHEELRRVALAGLVALAVRDPQRRVVRLAAAVVVLDDTGQRQAVASVGAQVPAV